MKMVGIKIIADNQEFTYEEFKKYLEKITDEKPEPTLQDKVREALTTKINSIHRYLQPDPYGYSLAQMGKEIIQMLGVQLYGMLKLQVIADVVNEGRAFDDVGWWTIAFHRGGEYFPKYQHNTNQRLFAPKLADEQSALKAIELMNIPYFEGDITLEDMR
jgi:hypothetical protein